MGQNAHTEGLGPQGYPITDLSQTQNAQRFSEKFRPVVFLSFPAASFDRSVRAGNLSGQGQEKSEDMFSHGYGVFFRAESNDDAGLGSRIHIDIVVAHPGSADDSQQSGIGDKLCRDFGLIADDEGFAVLQRGFQLGNIFPEVRIGANVIDFFQSFDSLPVTSSEMTIFFLPLIFRTPFPDTLPPGPHLGAKSSIPPPSEVAPVRHWGRFRP